MSKIIGYLELKIIEYFELIIKLIRAKKYSVPIKFRFFLLYIKLDLFKKFLNKESIIEIKILNKTIKCYNNYGFLKILFFEIFIDQPYYFEQKNESPIIFDCGANIGMATIFFKYLYPKSEIFAFEPDSDIFNLLKQNILINKLEKVHIFNVALSNIECQK
jgi:hypothetical protein